MTDNQRDIRELVGRWVAAIQARDLEAVVADHTDDIVMFDVLEVDITASDTVGYAYALLRCGTAIELTAKPAVRLRLSLGLRKQDRRWQIAHEHHSFPLA